MKTIKLNLFLLALAVISSTVTYAQEVVTDSIGTTQASVKTVEALLQGQVAGVRVWSMDGSPMSASGISIRGVNSIRGGHQPLFVVDGTILNGSNTRNIDPLWQYPEEGYINPLSQLSFLVPNDIESIEVLKNASATALYGSNGANGVIIIKTKRVHDERSVINWDSNLDLANPTMGNGTDLGISHNHRVMVGGAKNNSSYTLSGYFRDDNYIIPGTGATKGGLRASFDTQANPVVWFGLSSNFSVGNTKSAAATTWYGQQSMTTDMRNQGTSVEGWAADFDDHALEFRTVNSMWLQLNLFKGFTFKFDLGADYQYLTRNFWWGNGTALGAANNGVAAMLKTSSFAYNASGVFNYKPELGADHNLDASLGVQGVGGWDVFNTLNGTDFYNHSIRYKSLNIAASKAKLNYAKRKIFNLGIYGNVKYDYKGIIGADVAYRTDFSPTFGTWKMYPSVSAFWDIQKTFFDSSDVVSSLKFDIGYGESGRDEVLPYEYLGAFTTSDYIAVDPNSTPFFDGRSYLHSREWNLSLTYGMFEDRLTITAGYYKRHTSDRFTFYANGEQVMTTPPETEVDPDNPDAEEGEQVFVPEHRYWQWSDRREIGSQMSLIGNSGVEFAIHGEPVQTKDWTWSINVNGAYNINRIAELSVRDENNMNIGMTDSASGPLVATKNIEGHPVSSIVDSKGAVIGNPTPKYYGGLGTTLRWKDLTLDILTDGAAGFDILNLNAMAADKQTTVSSKYVEKGDFFRLARLSLAYNIPVNSIKWMESFKVFATATNLAVKSGYSGWSPDVNTYAVSNYRLGMDYGSYPAAKSFVLGLSIKF